MRLCTIEIRSNLGRRKRLGLILSESILDLNFATAWRLAADGHTFAQEMADALVPSSMLRFIQGGSTALNEAQITFERWMAQRPEDGPNEETLLYPRDEVRLVTPLPNPPSLRDFYTFEKHVQLGFAKRGESIPAEWYEMPVYYKGATHNLLGTEADVQWPPFTEKFDYELELVAVMGKRGRDIKAANAASHIFGYAVMNDFSARDVQRKEMKVRLGPAKGKDWATAIGPWIVTTDEIPNAQNLAMTARVNGELWSSGNSSDMRWTFEQIVEFLSNGDEVQAGDMIGSGTVGTGSGMEIDRWVKSGDLMELEVERIGVLRNTVVKPGAPQE